MLKTFLRMPLKQKLLIPRVIFWMCCYRRRIKAKPFSELAPQIGTQGHETELLATPRDARLLCELMESMRRRFRWEDSCLIRALTAKRLLNAMGHRCTLYMGVRKHEGEAMTAHAWLRCGTLIVTGADSLTGYTVTAVFGDRE